MENTLVAWRTGQTAAAQSVGALPMRETSELITETARGKRTWRIVSGMRLQVMQGRAERRMEAMRVGDRDIDLNSGEDPQRRPRRPIRSDLERAADALLAPHTLVDLLEPIGDPSMETYEGIQVVRIHTVAKEDTTVDHITWDFDAASGRLVHLRGVVRAGDRGTLAVEVGFRREGSADLPVWSRSDGSFQFRRRTRTYTVLVESEARYELAGDTL